MKTDYVIFDGELILEDDHIQIKDKNFRWMKSLMILSQVSIIFLGLIWVNDNFKMYDDYRFLLGLFFLIGGIFGLLKSNKNTFVKQLFYYQIEKVEIKHTWQNLLIADFKVTNGRKRRVLLDRDDFGRFEKFFLDDLVNALKDKHIDTELK